MNTFFEVTTLDYTKTWKNNQETFDKGSFVVKSHIEARKFLYSNLCIYGSF